MKKLLIPAAVLMTCGAITTQAQVKYGDNPTTINPNSLLELESTNKGLLMPRIPLESINSFIPLTAHVAGMTVFNTATAGTGASAVTPGFYYNDGTQWVRLAASSTVTDNQQLGLSGTTLTLTNGGSVSLSPFMDNTDAQQISLANNILTLSNGGTVDLSQYLADSDNQQITTFSLNAATNILTLTLEDGGTQNVDLSALKVEPWLDAATNTAATSNTQNIYQTGRVSIGGVNDAGSRLQVVATAIENPVNIIDSLKTNAQNVGHIASQFKWSDASIGKWAIGGSNTTSAPTGINDAIRFQVNDGTSWFHPMIAKKNRDIIIGADQNGNNRRFTILANGNTGIGSNLSPTNTLHVKANINPVRFEGLQPGASTDSVLTADATGVVRKVSAESLAGTEDWQIEGNSGTVRGTNFIGTKDNNDLMFKTNGQYRMHLNNHGGVVIGDSSVVYNSNMLNNFSGVRIEYSNNDVDGNLTSATPKPAFGIANLLDANVKAGTSSTGSVRSLSTRLNLTAETGGAKPSGDVSGASIYAYRGPRTALTTDGTGSIAVMAGLNVYAGNGTGSVGPTSRFYGINLQPQNQGTGTITDYYGYYMGVTNGNTGTITNKYGVYIDNDFRNYFKGSVGIGTVAGIANAKLHVVKAAADITPAIIEGCPVFADNNAATTGGVPVGGLYRTATGILMVRF